jgi:CRP/FNR family cyclic AMP-dependent transcriptional regulator
MSVTHAVVTATDTIRLLEVEPDFGRFLNEADEEAVGELVVPVVHIPAGDLNVGAVLSSHRAFAMILLDGIVVRRIVVGDSATLRLLGPGDLIGAPSGQSSVLIAGTGWRAAATSRAAILGREVLLAAHRAPRLVAGLQARSTEQSDRVALQLAICQLPRVEDRLLSMLWLLAESWGQVTAHGTALRLRLTHETLGGLVGARRSTVTLAIGQLTEEGAILRVDEGWLLLEPPPVFEGEPPAQLLPELLDPLEEVAPAGRTPIDAADVLARVRELREVRDELVRIRELNQSRTERDLQRAQETRLRSAKLREAIRKRRALESGRLRLHRHDGSGDAVWPAEREAHDGATDGPAPTVHRLEH